MTLYERINNRKPAVKVQLAGIGYTEVAIERRTLSQYLAAAPINAQLRELSQVAAELSVLLDVNDVDSLHLKYREV